MFSKSQQRKNSAPTNTQTHRKDLFDAFGDWMRLPVALVSGTLTGKLLSETLGFSGYDEKMIVIITAAVFTIFEVLMFRRWGIYRDGIALLIGILIATTSIAGSVGYFQVQLEKSIISSDEYLQQKAIVDNLIESSDPKKYPYTYLVGKRDLPKAQARLDEIRHNGAGVGNAFYKIFARLTGWSLEDSALAVTVFIAFVLEVILIYSAVKTDGEYTQEHTNTQHTPAHQGNGSSVTYSPIYTTSQNGKAEHTPESNGFKIPVGFVGGNGSRSTNAGKSTLSPTPSPDHTAQPQTVTVEKVIYRDRYIPTETELPIEGGYNEARQQAKRERLERVKYVLKTFPRLTVARQAQKAGLPLSTFKRLKSELAGS